MAGQSSDAKKIQLSKKYGIKIVEDASHSIGGNIKIEKLVPASIQI